MKVSTILLLLFIHPLTWAQKTDFNELGRALANYQACSKVAVTIKDDLMFNYYKKMFNDTELALLNINNEQAKHVYSAWDKSEKVLSHIGLHSLQNICLSRFDALSRKMLNKIATQ